MEESKAGAGGIAALAGQFGFDIGGGNGAGIFSGDNILLFLKSESLCRETLLTWYDDNNKITLIDQYIFARGWKSKWEKKFGKGYVEFGKYQGKVLPRNLDSLLQLTVNEILKNDLSVSKPDKKATFINVIVTTRDEKLSYLFSKRLVDIATSKYVQSKVKVKVANINVLQRRADSLAALLNNKTYISASNQQILVDLNPALRTAPITTEISTREKTMIGSIYAEVVKNLEISKTILSQETPAIQLVDLSSFPLPKVRPGKLKSAITFGFLFFLISVFYLAMKRIKI
jgi:hypothetical protein